MMDKTQGKYFRINKAYHELTFSLMSKKKLLKTTSKGVYASAACATLYELFKKIKLNQFKNFCDLGSGDGRVVAIASIFTKATGIEYDDELIHNSNNMIKKLNLSNCFFIKEDYLIEDLTKYDVLFINPDSPLYKLEKKLRDKNYKGLLIVFNSLYEPLNLEKKQEFFIDMMKIGIYKS